MYYNKKDILITFVVFCGLGLMIAIIYMLYENFDIHPLVSAGVFAIIGYFLLEKVILPQLGKKESEDAQEHKGECVYYTDVQAFSIKARNSYVADYLTIEKEFSLSAKYNPAQLTYTQIGAVGSFDFKNESIGSNAYPTGNYILRFGSSDKHYWVKSIQLSDDLLREAKANPFISQYIRGDELVLSTDPQPIAHKMQAAEYAMKTDGMRGSTVGINAVMQSMPVSILSQKDCVKILKWVSGK